MDMIDWSAAQRVGELIAGSPPYGGVLSDSVEPLVREFAERVATYSGLEIKTQLPTLEAVDRPAWIAANLKSMRPLLAPLTERAQEDSTSNGLLGQVRRSMRSASGLVLGAQVGALTGVLSQRVLGQYDLALLDSSVPSRLLLLAPNLAGVANQLGLDRDELVLWVSIHEITHAVQFSGAPWLRDYLGGLLKELIEGFKASILDKDSLAEESPDSTWRPKLPDLDELRQIVERARNGEVLRLTFGEDRWQLVDRMQAVMSLIEGHAEHTMDVVGAEVIPSLARLRTAMTRRRGDRGLPWRVFERLFGLELKMRQYEIGRRFCDAVVEDGGPQSLARAWSGPDTLPSGAELEDPQAWIRRMSGHADAAIAGGKS